MINEFYNCNGLDMLKNLDDKSVDLVLTDPPYITSKTTGMQKAWEKFEKEGYHKDITKKWGTKYAYKTDYGEWDSGFNILSLFEFVEQFHRVLREGGSCVIFFDLWKISELKGMLDHFGFTKIRFIEWIKTNPVPVNSKATYLSNSREIAISCVKGGKATFNSSYDKGIYEYPIYQGEKGVDRIHPTQKHLGLFEELIVKHTNPGDVVVDPFCGSGTTNIAAFNTNRNCYTSEMDEEYHKKATERIKYHT